MGESVSRWFAITINLETSLEGLSIGMLLIILIICIIVGIFQWRKAINDWLGYILCLIVITALPLGWYFVLSNHSCMHSFITYRTLAIAVMCILAFCWKLKPNTVTADGKNDRIPT